MRDSRRAVVGFLVSITGRCSRVWCVTPPVFWLLQTENTPGGPEPNALVPPSPVSSSPATSSPDPPLQNGARWLDAAAHQNRPNVLGLPELPDPPRPRQAIALRTPTSITLGCKPRRPSPRKGAEITVWSSVLVSGQDPGLPTASSVPLTGTEQHGETHL